jgi:hypothetical protein
MTIRSKPLGITIFVIFILGIGLSMAFNLWQTEGRKIPIRFSAGEFSGQYNPADIRGSYSFNDIEAHFDVTVDVLTKAFGVSDRETPGSFQVKELESLYGALDDGGEVGTDSIRLFVARYAGLPYNPNVSTRMPAPAISLLKDKISTDELEAIRKISVNLSELGNVNHDEPAVNDTHDESDRVVKGKTTFADLLDWGLTREEIEDILGFSMGARSETVRDKIFENNLEFGDYKNKLQSALDSK